MTRHPDLTTVSIVITTYNHARFLPDAIESVLSQAYAGIELIVVDDGSTDDTTAVMQRYPSCRYIYQSNSGLAAARNRGLSEATGLYVLFLDADDTLLPGAIKIQADHLTRLPEVAFVSGGHIVADAYLRPQREVGADIQAEHYRTLLTRNYIGMHAAVLYRRNVLEQFVFDTALSACEDYDVYLRVSRKHPVFTHTVPIAMYRTLSSGMSGNLPNMLATALKALKKQQPFLKTPAEREAYNIGIANWKNLYGYAMLEHLTRGVDKTTKQVYLSTLLHNKPRLYIRYFLNQIIRISNRLSNAGSHCLF
jgi:glycosyltransferase involved in cell wall biosynthesis